MRRREERRHGGWDLGFVRGRWELRWEREGRRGDKRSVWGGRSSGEDEIPRDGIARDERRFFRI